MVALLVALKLRLLRNGLRRSAWRVVGLVLGALYGLGIVVAVWLGMVALRFASVQLTGDVTVVAFSALAIGWLMLSLLVFGVDETVDPRRFALLPVPAERLLPGLLVAGLVGLPGAATVLVALSLLAAWSRGVPETIAALVAVVAGVATCVLLSRVATSAFTDALGSRRFRDFAAVVLALVGALIGIGANLASSAVSRDPGALRTNLHAIATVLGWTPFGWAWSVPADVAEGAWLRAAVRLVLALALVLVLARAWRFFLARALCSPLDAGGTSTKVRRGGALDRLLPPTRVGAVAGRSLRYWRRDPRYLAALASLIILPVVLVVVVVAQPGSGGGAFATFMPVLFALLIASTVAADLSYDGSALWTHVTSGVPGADDRRGRVVSTLTIMVPILLLALVGATAVTGAWSMLPATSALTVVFLLGGAGVGSVVGVLVPMPAAPPGASPFARNSNGGLKGLVSFALSSVATVLVSLPVVALVVAAVWVPWLVWVALVVAPVVGTVVLVLGIRVGGRTLDRRWPEVLTAVTAQAAG